MEGSEAGGGSDVHQDAGSSSNGRPSASGASDLIHSSNPSSSRYYGSGTLQATLNEFATQNSLGADASAPPRSIQIASDELSCASSVTTAHFQNAEIFRPSMYPSTEGIGGDIPQSEVMELDEVHRRPPPTCLILKEEKSQKEIVVGKAKPSLCLQGSKEDETTKLLQLLGVIATADSPPTIPELAMDKDKPSSRGSLDTSKVIKPISPPGVFAKASGFHSSTNLPLENVNSCIIPREEYTDAISETNPIAPTGVFARVMGFQTSHTTPREDLGGNNPRGGASAKIGATNNHIPQPEPSNTQSQPGAYHVRPVHTPREFEEETMSSDEESEQDDSLQQDTIMDSDLVVARPLHLEIATPHSEESFEDGQGGHSNRNAGISNKAKCRAGTTLAVTVCSIMALASFGGIRIFGTDPTKLKHLRVKEIVEGAFGSDYFDTEQKEKALYWVSYEDPLQDLQVKQDLETNTNGLLQRFSLVSFYFQTSFQNPWPYCSPPMTGQSDLCYFTTDWEPGRPKEYTGTRWLSGAHECNWMGIECTRDSKLVTEINFAQKNLTGVIPSDISRLPRLTKLDLHLNNLSGSLPTWISKLSSLDDIKFSSNYFSGSVPPEYLATKILELSNNLLTGTIPVGNQKFWKSQTLVLSRNMLCGSLPSEIYSMSHLKSLTLANNNLTGSLSSEVGKLSDLSHFYLNGNTLLGGDIPSEIGNLKKLKQISLGWTSIAGTIPDSLYGLKDLWGLELSGSRISGTISSRIGLLTKLGQFSIADTRISGTLPEDISKLSQLDQLYVNGNPNLVGSIPRNFCSLQLNHRSDIVADCAPSTSAGTPALICPKDCCTQCCDAETKICLDTP